MKCNSRGVALIMVLWVITILSVVVLEFSYAMRTEVNITRNYQEELRLYAAAQGGIQRAIAELILKHDPEGEAGSERFQTGRRPQRRGKSRRSTRSG